MNQIGIDVSNLTFDASRQSGQALKRRQFAYTPGDINAFIRWALQGADSARVCLEATGIYHLQLALALHRHEAIEVMVVNPRAARRFIQAHLVRAKTDAIDADGLLLFLQRMPFKRWSPPSERVLQLQSLAHRMAQLDKAITRERSRLHAARRAGPHTRLVQQDLQSHIKQLQRRLQAMRHQARAVIQNDPHLHDWAQRAVTVTGLAELSAIRLIAELAALPNDMGPQQWVAQAGLDPKALESGTSLRPPRRISKQGNARIRAALYMPALVAAHHDPNVAAYYQHLQARGKPKMVALTAVMRRLLHALWGMQHHQQEWDGDKFFKLNTA